MIMPHGNQSPSKKKLTAFILALDSMTFRTLESKILTAALKAGIRNLESGIRHAELKISFLQWREKYLMVKYMGQLFKQSKLGCS